jgi:hypothetical protein
MRDDHGLRLVLSLFFKAVIGVRRIFHFETLVDSGFAVLSGGPTVLSRHDLGNLVRRAPLAGVRRLMALTAPAIKRASTQTISIDEHVIARFTRKFSIRKGYHTIRNKHMRVEKLAFAFHTCAKTLLSLVATRGHVALVDIAETLLPSLRRRARGAQIRLILDAGAAKNYHRMLNLADHAKQVTIVRVPRRPAYLNQWQQISPERWREIHEPGPYKAAPTKLVHVADTVMTLRDAETSTQRPVRTVVVRERTRRRKDRWHALWVFHDDHTDAWDIVAEFRTRQHHEQEHRLMLHDAHIETACSGYDKNSPNPSRPGFKQAPITLYGWTVALAMQALGGFAATLPKSFHRAHPRTLRRWFLETPAALFLGKGTLIVSLRPRHMLHVWQRLIAPINRHGYRIPWLDDRRLVLSLDSKGRFWTEVRVDPPEGPRSVWC